VQYEMGETGKKGGTPYGQPRLAWDILDAQ
jgi:hypothetical protein